ncbi:MAG TPA: thioredoxin family protein [Thermoguttaceae bacterium]|nr:thioredoxin family protein [Thermoguttaceae bacterium]
MTGLTFAVVIQASVLLTTTTNSYRDARQDCSENGRPMIVLVGAEWCPACVEMKNQVMPKVQRRGLLRKVAFAIVDLDRQKRLGRELTGGGPIPQVIMYRKTPAGWRLRRLIGGQSAETIATFINEGVQANKTTKDNKPNSSEKTPNPQPESNRTT